MFPQSRSGTAMWMIPTHTASLGSESPHGSTPLDTEHCTQGSPQPCPVWGEGGTPAGALSGGPCPQLGTFFSTDKSCLGPSAAMIREEGPGQAQDQSVTAAAN